MNPISTTKENFYGKFVINSKFGTILLLVHLLFTHVGLKWVWSTLSIILYIYFLVNTILKYNYVENNN